MRFSKLLKIVYKSQWGFTLIELLVATAITGVLGVGVVTALAQIGKVNDEGNAHVMAVNQVENAIHSFNRDIQMAQTVTPQGPTGFPLTLIWTTWGNPAATPPVPPATTQIVYSLVDDGTGNHTYNLYRNDGTTNKIISQLITSATATANADASLNPPKTWYTIQITATASSGQEQASETRKIDIIPRPGS